MKYGTNEVLSGMNHVRIGKNAGAFQKPDYHRMGETDKSGDVDMKVTTETMPGVSMKLPDSSIMRSSRAITTIDDWQEFCIAGETVRFNNGHVSMGPVEWTLTPPPHTHRHQGEQH